MRAIAALAIIVLSGALGCAVECGGFGISPSVYWLGGTLTGMLAIGIVAGGD